MAQRGRIRVSTITESKMFAKKMHRLVKKMQDKPSDSLDPLELLSEMARKKGENLSIPIEVETETQWATLLKREGLIVVDVYSGWSGPCTSMFSILRKLKLDTNDDRMILAAANADNISQLAPFRNQSEPCWLFIGGGKPVNVLRGSNAPKLVRTIKSELQYELGCIEGKNKRNLISIKYEASRREQAVNEAIALDQLIALEEEERKAKEKEPSPPVETDITEEKEIEIEESIAEKESSEIVDRDENAEEEEPKADEKENRQKDDEAKREAEALLLLQQERRELMEKSNVRLQDALRMYTVIAIQSYLLETGAVTEIKDHLSSDFNLVKERYISLTDDDARKLFGIPSEMPDPNPPVVPEEDSNAEEMGEGQDADSCAEDEKVPSKASSPVPATEANEPETEKKDGENADENREGSDVENEESKAEDKKPVIRMIEIPVPNLIIGDTLILLLECTKVEPKKKALVKAETEEGEETEEVEMDETADYFIAKRIGSEDFETATETQPESLHAMYGKEKYVAGIWCPRKYEEKRFVMLNYFPQFVTEMLMPPIPDPPNDTDDSPQEHEDISAHKEQ